MPLMQQLTEAHSMSGQTPLSPPMRQGTHSCPGICTVCTVLSAGTGLESLPNKLLLSTMLYRRAESQEPSAESMASAGSVQP